MYYSFYKNVRNSAWQCLLDFGIDRLPVDLVKITRGAGIRLIRNSHVDMLQAGERARSYSDGSTWVFVYDDSLPVEEARFAVAHELGHFLLGHEETLAYYADRKQTSAAEKHADAFACRLLCPACVLWALNAADTEEIAALCLVDREVARNRADRMRALRKRNCFLQDPVEQALYEQFQGYICKRIGSKADG